MKYSLLFLSLISALGVAKDKYTAYPDEFSDFFHETPQNILINIAGERDSVQLSSIVSYDSFRLERDSESYKYLNDYLMNKGLTENASLRILNDIVAGVKSDSECTGRLNKCVLSVEAGLVRYVFDFDHSQLKIFVPASGLKNTITEVEYESSLNHDKALINWLNFYASSDVDGANSLNISNKSVVGLPAGHIDLDTQYTQSNDSFNVYEALYDVDYRGYRLQAGRSRYNLSFNTTDYLSAGATLSADSVFVGTSANLVKGKQEDLQRLHFYAPQNGQLEVYRDERLIYNAVVNEGKQYVSYADLPKGVYSVNIVLKVSGQVVVDETRQIVNNNQFTLPVGRFDFVVGAGKFVDFYSDHLSRENLDDKDELSSAFARGMVNYRVNESLLIGGGLTISEDQQYYQMGVNYFYSDLFSISYNGGLFSDGDIYQYARLSSGAFYFDVRQYNQRVLEEVNGLGGHLYGVDNYTDLSVGISGNLLSGTGYLSYNRYMTESYDIDSINSTRETVKDYISGGWSTSLFGGSLSASTSYVVDYNGDDEVRLELTWSRSFGDVFSTQVRVNGDERSINNNTNYLSAQKKYERWVANATVGANFNQQNEALVGADLSTTLHGSTDELNANLYGYINDDGLQRYSAGFSGSQIISRSGIDFSQYKSEAFAKVARKTTEENTEPLPSINYNISRDGDFVYRGKIESDSTLLRIKEYAQVGIYVDGGGHNVSIEGDKKHGFVHPGSVYELETKVIPLMSRIVVLDDIFNNPVNMVQCIGEGCVSVEPLSTDGVFRINYRQSSNYQLVSRKGICISESNSDRDYAKGYCLPGIDAQENQTAWQDSNNLLDNTNKSNLLVYLGRFDKSAALDGVTRKLKGLCIAYKEISIESSVYIYLVNNAEFTDAQKEFLKELDAYVLLRDSEFDLLTISKQLGANDGV